MFAGLPTRHVDVGFIHRRWANVSPTPVKCMRFGETEAEIQCWFNIEPQFQTVGQRKYATEATGCISWVSSSYTSHETLTQCCFNFGPASTTPYQH